MRPAEDQLGVAWFFWLAATSGRRTPLLADCSLTIRKRPSSPGFLHVRPAAYLLAEGS